MQCISLALGIIIGAHPYADKGGLWHVVIGIR